jgi:DNA-binding NarL/FixJ family response regulator
MATPQECRVLELSLSGLSREDIATHHGMARSTVDVHFFHLKQKYARLIAG